MKLKDLDESAVSDNGRRGPPLPGCDCEWCFGYCDVDREKYARELGEYRLQASRARASFDDPI